MGTFLRARMHFSGTEYIVENTEAKKRSKYHDSATVATVATPENHQESPPPTQQEMQSYDKMETDLGNALEDMIKSINLSKDICKSPIHPDDLDRIFAWFKLQKNPEQCWLRLNELMQNRPQIIHSRDYVDDDRNSILESMILNGWYEGVKHVLQYVDFSDCINRYNSKPLVTLLNSKSPDVKRFNIIQEIETLLLFQGANPADFSESKLEQINKGILT